MLVSDSLAHSLTHSLTDSCLVNLIDVTLACEYAHSKLEVVTVAGDGFGASGYLRFSFATNKDTIISGIDRIKKSLKKLK